MMQQSLAHF